MHGRRQFVVWIVPLSGVTNATLVGCYKCQPRLPQIEFTTRAKKFSSLSMLRIESGEEGEDDARSACPSDIRGYTHNTMAVTTWRNTVRWSQPLEKRPKFGLRSATRPHEAGITSNRGSAIPRWIRSQVLYSPPVNSREPGIPEISLCGPTVSLVTGSKS